MNDGFKQEVKDGNRFEFGKNWSRFLDILDDERIGVAENSLRDMLGRSDLDGLTFLDIGSGSGLFSLVARRLGARVFSFDYDSNSVACTNELKRRYFPGDDAWRVEQGSVLDKTYLASLGKFDIVYSWGVLHHTGRMWDAITNAMELVKPGGVFFIAIYNDQGIKSKVWRMLKRIYNKLPSPLRLIYSALMFALIHTLNFLKYCFLMKPMTPIREWRNYTEKRGMNPYVDWIDWIGGYPFEVASVEAIVSFHKSKKFDLLKVKRNMSLGCSEYIFINGAE